MSMILLPFVLICLLAPGSTTAQQADPQMPTELPRFQDWIQLWALPDSTAFLEFSERGLSAAYRDTVPPGSFPIDSLLVWSPDSTLGVDFLGCNVGLYKGALSFGLDDAWNVFLVEPRSGARTLVLSGGISLWAQDAEWTSSDTFWIYGRLVDGHGQCNLSAWRVDLSRSQVTEFRGPLLDPGGEQIWTDWQALLGDRFPFLR